MGKSFSKLFSTVGQASEHKYFAKEVKNLIQSFIPGGKYKNLSVQQSTEISFLNKRIDLLENEVKKEREIRDQQVLQSSQREEVFVREKQNLEEKNTRLTEQLHDLFKDDRNKTNDDHLFQLTITESQNKMLSKLSEIEKLNQDLVNPKTPSKIGELGEEFVLKCLENAFPNHTSLEKMKGNNSGDIHFRIENTDKRIMFEVKNYANQAVSSAKNGTEITKFFHDLDNPKSSHPVHGGVLISLNGPVDVNCQPLVPKFYHGKPYIFIDSLKVQYPDPDCLLKVVVNMMTFLVKNSDEMEIESYSLKLETYLEHMRHLMKNYQMLYRNNENQRKGIESLKSSLSNLNNVFLEDKKQVLDHEQKDKDTLLEELP